MNDTTWLKDGLIAHRGLHTNDFPENTTGAFLNAVRNGYDIELDVRMTKDGKLIVIHDDNLNRLCQIASNVKDLKYDELKSYKILHTTETIPLLSDVLEIIPTTTRLLIELKSSKNNKKLVSSFFKIMHRYNHSYAVHSFSPYIVYLTKNINPKIARGQISKKYKFSPMGFLLARLSFNVFTKPDCITYKFADLPYLKLDKLKLKGMTVISYTVTNEQDLIFVKSRYHNAVFEDFLPKIK